MLPKSDFLSKSAGHYDHLRLVYVMYFLLREMSNTQTKTWLAKKLFSKVLFYYFWKDFRMPNMSNLIFSLHTISKKKGKYGKSKEENIHYCFYQYLRLLTCSVVCSATYCRFIVYRVLLEGGDRIDRWDTKLSIDTNQKTACRFERATYTIAILLRSRICLTQFTEMGKYKLCKEWGFSAQSQGIWDKVFETLIKACIISQMHDARIQKPPQPFTTANTLYSY